QDGAAAVMAAFHQRSCSLVAGRLNAENDHEIIALFARSSLRGYKISPQKAACGVALRGLVAQSSIHLRIGTRGSPLALAQANMVRALLAAAHGVGESAVEIVVIRTTGDVIQDRPLAD